MDVLLLLAGTHVSCNPKQFFSKKEQQIDNSDICGAGYDVVKIRVWSVGQGRAQYSRSAWVVSTTVVSLEESFPHTAG